MKKIWLLILAVYCTYQAGAQHKTDIRLQPVRYTHTTYPGYGSRAMKTSAIGDTSMLRNIADSAMLTIYSFDSGRGYATGTNFWGDQAFAERYDFNGTDSSVQVIGLYAMFGGSVNPASGRTLTFDIWDQGVPYMITDTLLYSGYPDNLLDSITVPVTNLGMGTILDTGKAFLFAAPTALLTHSFFVGYNMNYNYSTLDGDTLALYSSLNGDRTGAKYRLAVSILGTDTTFNIIRNVQNATMTSDYNWHDNYYDNDSLSNDLAIYPIVVIGGVEGVSSITRNDLTFYGSYPNPAGNTSNIRFSLSSSADVTISVMDMSGRQVLNVMQPPLSAGEHIVPVSTASLPCGDYVYLIHTSHGGGVCGKIAVAR